MVWNPVTGCTKCSPGCDNCYAERMTRRFWRQWGCEAPPHHFNIKLHPDRLMEPLHWRKPRRIFVCSMGDLFHPAINIGFLTHIFDIIKDCHQHTFIILTKRPDIALKMMWGKHGEGWRYFDVGDYHKNIQFFVTICTKDEMWKVTELCRIPAAVRGISFEPLLEDVGEIPLTSCREDDNDLDEFGQHIDQVIIGGESGPGARPMGLGWVRNVRDQCAAKGVPFFFKQWGEWIPGSQAGHIKDLTKYKCQQIKPPAAGGFDVIYTFKVTKKKAGHLLDGKEHRELI